MPKIPSMTKFKGDNEVSFNKWILRFEAQSDALDVENNKKRQVLLCCLEDSAFTLASQRITTENGITHNQGFFGAGQVSCNRSTMINTSCTTYKRRAPQGKISLFFLQDILKTAFQMRI